MNERPQVVTHRLLQPDGSEREVDGQLLGFGTSRREYHSHALPRDLGTHGEGWKCSACRWFEVSIIWIPDDEVYVIYTVGRSTLPGESPRARIQVTESPFEIIEMLTDRRPDPEGRPRPARLPIAAARCVAQAAAVDPGITEAYVNRAVV